MKKKLFTLLLASTLFVLPVSAAEIDLGSMTVTELTELKESLNTMTIDELVKLRDSVNIAISDLGGDNEMGAGIYEVGTDIRPGTFSFICSGKTRYDSANLYVYESMDDFKAENEIIFEQVKYNEEDPAKSEVATFNLKEGQVIDVQDTVIIQEVKASWAP